jgi:hypothetical protein
MPGQVVLECKKKQLEFVEGLRVLYQIQPDAINAFQDKFASKIFAGH